MYGEAWFAWYCCGCWFWLSVVGNPGLDCCRTCARRLVNEQATNRVNTTLKINSHVEIYFIYDQIVLTAPETGLPLTYRFLYLAQHLVYVLYFELEF